MEETPIGAPRIRWFLFTGFSIWLICAVVFGMMMQWRLSDQRLWARRFQTCLQHNGVWKSNPFYPRGLACVRRDISPDTNTDFTLP
jgi:hypothetical protein